MDRLQYFNDEYGLCRHHLTLCPTHITEAAPQVETFISSQIGLLIHTPQLITLGQAPLTFLLISSYLKCHHVILGCCLQQNVHPAPLLSLPELVQYQMSITDKDILHKVSFFFPAKELPGGGNDASYSLLFLLVFYKICTLIGTQLALCKCFLQGTELTKGVWSKWWEKSEMKKWKSPSSPLPPLLLWSYFDAYCTWSMYYQ